MAGQFNGKIELDIRDSQPDWDAFLDQKAPKDAPNVLVILYDDTGLCGVVARTAGESTCRRWTGWRRTD